MARDLLATAIAFIAAVAVLLAAFPAFAASARESSAPTRAGPAPPLHVSIVSHNEEPPGNPDYYNNSAIFWKHRSALVNFSLMLHNESAQYNYQSDWNFLKAIARYDSGTPSTGAKNILLWMKEDMGFEVDPHAHETKYNYADVAYFISALGVEPSGVVGGFIADPPASSKLEYLWDTLTAKFAPNYTWKAQLAWGGGTANHIAEQNMWVSGIWKPKGNGEFTVHDPAAPLPNIGRWRSDWMGFSLQQLNQQNGTYNAGRMHTQTITIRQGDLLSNNFIDAFRMEIENRSALTSSGAIKWVGLWEAYQIWQSNYSSQPNIYSYVFGDISPVDEGGAGLVIVVASVTVSVFLGSGAAQARRNRKP